MWGDLTFVINGFEYTLPNDDWVEKYIDYDPAPTKMAQVGPRAENFLVDLHESPNHTNL